jgi:hypothetical protein
LVQQALAAKECVSQPPVIAGIFGPAFLVFWGWFGCLQNGFARVTFEMKDGDVFNLDIEDYH